MHNWIREHLPHLGRVEWLMVLMSLGILLTGAWTENHLAIVSAVVCVLIVLNRRQPTHPQSATKVRADGNGGAGTVVAQRARLREATSPLISPKSSAAYVREMIFQGRYALLVRSEVAKNLSSEQREEVIRAFQEEMSYIKGGRVSLQIGAPHPAGSESDVQMESIFVDRYAVTNLEFQEFVNAGGYDQAELWAPEVQDTRECFVDQSGRPGPRYWRDGNYPPGTAHLPVVGVSWYEADAFARWAGKRLPDSSEWIRAALGVTASNSTVQQPTRFPWGNMFRDERANLWISGRGQTVPVEEYPCGQTQAGIRQLIGNTWEWMSDDLSRSFTRGELVGSSAQMKAIRGGAFNTYLESQATCHGVSGDYAAVRRDNIGFRCVLSVKDADANLLSVCCAS